MQTTDHTQLQDPQSQCLPSVPYVIWKVKKQSIDTIGSITKIYRPSEHENIRLNATSKPTHSANPTHSRRNPICHFLLATPTPGMTTRHQSDLSHNNPPTLIHYLIATQTRTLPTHLPLSLLLRCTSSNSLTRMIHQTPHLHRTPTPLPARPPSQRPAYLPRMHLHPASSPIRSRCWCRPRHSKLLERRHRSLSKLARG